MSLPDSFVACPSCGCHAKSHEVDCPHCGGRLRRGDGTLPRTAAAILLGLTTLAAPAMIGCSDGEGGGSGGAGGQGGQGGTSQMSSATGAGGAGGTMVASGVGGVAPAYGVGMTDQDGDGYFNVLGGGDDCNDMDANIHPGAAETPGDSIDSNCDGNDNT